MELLTLLKRAAEVDRDSTPPDGWGWTIIKIHRYGWSSRSGRHTVDVSFPPFFVSHSYTYYLLKPLFRISVRDLLTEEGVWANLCEYPIEQELISRLAKSLGLGYIAWQVSRGLAEVLFCRYIDHWEQCIIDDLETEMIVRSLKPQFLEEKNVSDI